MPALTLEYWTTDVMGFAGALLLCALVASRTRSWLTFAHLFSLFWGANILVSQIALNGLLRPRIGTLLVLFAAWWLFLVGTLTVLRRPPAARSPLADIHRARAVFLLGFLVGMQGLAVAVELRALGHSPMTFLRDFVENAIRLREDVEATAGYFPTWSVWRWDQVLYIPLALLLHSRSMISGRLVALIYVWAVVLAAARFTRLPLIGLAAISFVAWLHLYKPTRRARLLIGAILATVGFAVFARTQTTLIGRQPWSPVTAGQSLVAYIGSSPLAYETLLQGFYPRVPGVLYSLEPLNYMLYKLSLISAYPGLSRPEADVPIATNVYTFLDTFTLDWGVPGALVGSFLLGLVVAWSYNRLCKRSDYAALTIYCYFSYCCVIAIANNEFIRMAVVINILLATWINWAIARRPLPATLHPSREHHPPPRVFAGR